ncbi:AAA family ATPase [Alicyclobacillus acidiphilus]|uniref:AAA family ATPase n=1 Tax=Alicyclobacillus acidiphilus TaxID=182455 RepID=UPI00083018DA|nr:AAA family ATPase [Alicyclobacillus acidiphilus]
MLFLRTVQYEPGEQTVPSKGFPFDIPVLHRGCRIHFSSPVTILVGENGTGKSTLLEAMATAIGLPAIGAADASEDPTLVQQRALGATLRLTWNRKTRRGFFLRAEDFFNFCRHLRSIKEDALEQLHRIDADYEQRSTLAKQQAKLPYARALSEMRTLYGDDLDAMSHGESFLQLFSSRIGGQGLFILDEPEAPLSPLRQLTLLHLVHEAVEQGSQFLIATHSPIVMAYPGATILHLTGGDIIRTDWSELEHVSLLRDFLARPDAFLRRLSLADGANKHPN